MQSRTNTSQELLPCPFCGGEAELLADHAQAWVECDSTSCDASTAKKYSLEEAVDVWNRRQPMDVRALTDARIRMLAHEHLKGTGDHCILNFARAVLLAAASSQGHPTKGEADAPAQQSASRYCKDCAHFRKTIRAYECHAPRTLRENLVIGPQPILCTTAREDGQSCGPHGMLFEAKPVHGAAALELAKLHASHAVIVYGPPGCGKTRNAVKLTRHFGKIDVIDDWHPSMSRPAEALCLTNVPDVPGALPYADLAATLNLS